MNTIGIGLLVEEHRGEIATAWRGAVSALGGEPALGFAVAPLLRELSLALRDEGGGHGPEACARIAVLVRSSARPAQLAREMKHLQRAVWEALTASGEPIAPHERLALDGWLFDALAECVDRLERARLRLEELDRPAGAGSSVGRATPPPLPHRNGATTH